LRGGFSLGLSKPCIANCSHFPLQIACIFLNPLPAGACDAPTASSLDHPSRV
jgi:hypothetical protein